MSPILLPGLLGCATVLAFGVATAPSAWQPTVPVPLLFSPRDDAGLGAAGISDAGTAKVSDACMPGSVASTDTPGPDAGGVRDRRLSLPFGNRTTCGPR